MEVGDTVVAAPPIGVVFEQLQRRAALGGGPACAVRVRIADQDVRGEGGIGLGIELVDDLYPDADGQIAPDILVGYADTYRASWSTAAGGSPLEWFEDNTDRWSGDHCIAHYHVPGILVTNRTVRLDDPNLTDLAPTVLGLYGIDAPPEMTGRNLFLEMDRGEDQD